MSAEGHGIGTTIGLGAGVAVGAAEEIGVGMRTGSGHGAEAAAHMIGEKGPRGGRGVAVGIGTETEIEIEIGIGGTEVVPGAEAGAERGRGVVAQ